jgi:hypothetical protein
MRVIDFRGNEVVRVMPLGDAAYRLEEMGYDENKER